MRDTLGCDKFVYFMHREDNGWIKIGISNKPYRRREEIQKEVKSIVRLFPMLMIPDRSFDTAYKLEQKLHKSLHSRRMDGEWFKTDGDPYSFICWVIKWVVIYNWGYLVPFYYHDTRDASVIYTKPEDTEAMYLPAKYANTRYLAPRRDPYTKVLYRPKINNKTLKFVNNYILDNFEKYQDELHKLGCV